MANAAELIAARNDAGAAYRAAVEAYVDAWKELHAYDLALSNSNVRVIATQGFNTSLMSAPPMLHPQFLPPADRDALVSPNLFHPVVIARAEQIANSFEP